MEMDMEDRDRVQELFAKRAVFKPTKVYLLLTAFIFFFAGCGAVGIIFEMIEKKGKLSDGLVPFLMGFAVCTFFVGMGSLPIVSYHKSKKRLQAALMTYGEENIRHSIQRSLLWFYVYPFGSAKVFLTESYVIAPREAIFRYEDISLMTKSITTGKSRVIQVAFYMKDGTIYRLCNGIRDEEINRVMEICRQMNENILFGYSNENKRLHEERVRSYR